jgi:hypothetical protein
MVAQNAEGDFSDHPIFIQGLPIHLVFWQHESLRASSKSSSTIGYKSVEVIWNPQLGQAQILGFA